ncbi:MAG TPA: hypothetical protein VMW50_13370 [Dehalococcoidia bacterium]|uniref:Uncharacterized protein n=1 Tax=viral metagenome TaxID=1070528 RepID=A0A6M3IMU1_9ZZZZ|nr:hypothetical protein [Dehalococcoidia bacterium]
MKNNEEAPEPSEEPYDEPSEDPKDIARAMLIAGKTDEEVAEETGLSIRSVWGVKGALAKAGQIPTRSELKERERKKPGPAEQEFREAREGVPFRRARPAHVLIETILNQFGVKDRARDLIISRAERAGGMHPSELERSLMDLDTGLKKREVSYITEEYYLAMQQEEDTSLDLESRSYPMRRGESGRGAGYPTRYGGRDYPSTGYDEGFERRPWDRSYDPGKEGGLTRGDLMDILERRERDLEDRMRRSTLEDKMGSIGEDISVLATELRNLKENPPTVTEPKGPSDYERTLQHTIDRQDKRQEELMTLIKEERSEAKEDMKEIRETYEDRLEKQKEEFRDELDKRGTPYDTTGYKEDSIRLAAEGLHEVADVARARGSPFKIIIEGLPTLMGVEGSPPQRERGRPASVADLVGPEYVER